MLKRYRIGLAVLVFVVFNYYLMMGFAQFSQAQRLALDERGDSIQALGIGTTQVIAYDGSVAQANAFAKVRGHVVVRVVSDTDSHIICDSATPTATTLHLKLPALSPEYFSVAYFKKCAIIKSAVAGNAYITEMD